MLFSALSKIVWVKARQHVIKDKNVLYVIAHPDDESMFFIPSIRKIRKRNKIFLLSLSNGDAEGQGKVRTKELEKACRYLKFNDSPVVIDDPDLQDGMKTEWSEELVAEQVTKYLTAKSREGPEHKIDIIVTFDELGMTEHPNHIAVNKGVCKVVSDRKFDLELYALETQPPLRRFTSYCDIIWCEKSMYHLFTWNLMESWWALAYHATQFVWYRKLSVIFSRNTFCNTF